MRTIIRDNYTPELGQYHERIIIDPVKEKTWLFDCDGVFLDITKVFVANEYGDNKEYAISQDFFTKEVQQMAEDLSEEEAARIAADEDLQDQIDVIKAASDVVDIVGTYAELLAYDTSKLTDSDIIKVLADENHDGATTYYRWMADTTSWSYIGEQGPYYTQTEVDNLLDEKQDVLTAGDHIDITGTTISGIVDDAHSFTSTNPLENDVISKTLWHKDAITPNGVDGIYIGTGTYQWGSNRSITIGRNAPTASATPADKISTIEIGTTAYATGRNAIAMGSSANPTQAAGENDIAIGRGNTTAGSGSTDTPGINNTAIGRDVTIRGSDNIGVGNLATSNNRYPADSTYESKGFGSVAIGSHTSAWRGSVALGSWSNASEEGVVAVGNNSGNPDQAIKRRIIYMADGIADTDAVNVRQLNAAIASITPNNISSADWSALWQ